MELGCAAELGRGCGHEGHLVVRETASSVECRGTNIKKVHLRD